MHRLQKRAALVSGIVGPSERNLVKLAKKRKNWFPRQTSRELGAACYYVTSFARFVI